jgi:hypothetical protein
LASEDVSAITHVQIAREYEKIKSQLEPELQVMVLDLIKDIEV